MVNKPHYQHHHQENLTEFGFHIEVLGNLDKSRWLSVIGLLGLLGCLLMNKIVVVILHVAFCSNGQPSLYDRQKMDKLRQYLEVENAGTALRFHVKTIITCVKGSTNSQLQKVCGLECS